MARGQGLASDRSEGVFIQPDTCTALAQRLTTRYLGLPFLSTRNTLLSNGARSTMEE